jgi:hypothetical protein
MINPGEAALAVIGMDAVLRNDVPRVGVEKLREIDNLEKTVQAKARDLIAGDLSTPAIPRVHSYRFLLDRLSRPLPPAEVEGFVSRFIPEGAETAGLFTIQVQQVMDKLKAMFPTSEYVTFTGPKTMVPAADAVFKFFNQYMVINDPLLVFDLMAEGALLSSQAKSVQDSYPTLSGNKDEPGAITAALYDAIAKAKAAKKSYQLPRKIAAGVANWLGNRTADFNPNPSPRIVPTVKRPTTAPLKTIPQTKGTSP